MVLYLKCQTVLLTIVVAALTRSRERPREAVEDANRTEAPPSLSAPSVSGLGEALGDGDISCLRGGERGGSAEWSE